jgi:hypothetical protein
MELQVKLFRPTVLELCRLSAFREVLLISTVYQMLLTNSSGGTIGLGTGALANDDGSANLNTAVGFDALNDVVTGSRNTAVGHSAGSKMTGQNNTFVGERAGHLVSTGTENTACGSGALIAAITGNGNSAFGVRALGSDDATSMKENVAVGYYAGYSITTGFGNTVIGYDNGVTGILTTGTNNIVLGNKTSSSSATVSNEITLGNASVTSFRIPGVSFYNLSGNVGIGTASPAKQLTITKSALATINALTDGATITPDFDAGQNFSVTLAGNRTLANPTNIDAGQTGSIFITQDGTGSRTLSFGSYWDFAGGTAPTLSTAAASVDRIDYIVRTGTSIHAVATLNLS